MPLLNNYLANSPNFLGGISSGQSSGTVEPQRPGFEKTDAFGGGGFGPPQGGGGMGGLFGRDTYFGSANDAEGTGLWNFPSAAEHSAPTPVPMPQSPQPQMQPMMPPPTPAMGISPMFSAPQYNPPMATSAAVQQATPEIQKFMNPQTSPNYTANAMPIYNR